MAAENLIPGAGYVHETATTQALVPGAGYVNETVSAGTTTYTLTSATWVPGSITATGVTPRIVRTKA